jgi:hypothetical protein
MAESETPQSDSGGADRQVPTLLVGLGGIGSQVVERVFERIPSDQRGRVALHVFDTNSLDLKDLRHLHDVSSRTQLGTANMVGEYRLRYPETEAWFPYGHRELDLKSTLAGAGQVRAVSRLTLKHLLHRSADQVGIRSAVDKLFTLRETGGLRFNPRVMIVNSWAGGTGAGAFIQVALFLTELIAQRLSTSGGVIVRGFFVMPDILVDTRVLHSDQWELVRSNAQACLKELEAIRMANRDDTEPVLLESRAGGDRRPVRDLPFEYSYLFDYQNVLGDNLNSVDQYLDQVGRCVHLALFSPLSQDQFSQEDNNIRILIGEQGKTRYGSAATSSLIYPAAEVIDYLATGWAAGEIDEHWLRIDLDYAREIDRYERDLRQGIYQAEPSRSRHFRAYLEELQGSENAPPYFKEVYRQAFLMDDKGRPDAGRAEAWVVALERHIEEGLDLESARSLNLDPALLRKREYVEEVVIGAEQQIYDAWEEVKRYIGENTAALVSQVLTRDGEEPHLRRGEGEHRLNFWTLAQRSDALHPLAVRFLLYQAHELIEGRLLELGDENRRLREVIETYEQRYDLLEQTPDRVEDAVDRVRAVLSQPFHLRMFRNDLKAFAELYEQESSDQYRRVRRYAGDKLKEEVLRRLAAGLGTFISEFERFFDGLRSVRDRLEGEHNRLEAVHEERDDPTIKYVLADRASKKRLWDAYRGTTLGNEDAVTIHTVAYSQLYGRLCRLLRHEEVPLHAVQDFRTTLLATLRTRVATSPTLPANVIEALVAEAEGRGVDPETHLLGAFQSLVELAQPYFQLRSWRDRGSYRFYGLHRGAHAALPDGVRSRLDAHAQYDPAFDGNEVVFYTVLAGFGAEELTKFTPPLEGDDEGRLSGVYYRAYRDQLESVRSSGHVTPHIDRSWHNSLPDFWLAEGAVDRVLIQGLALGTFALSDEGWMHQLERLAPYRKGDLQNLRDALEQRDDLSAAAHDAMYARGADDRTNYPGELHRHAFIKGVRKVGPEGENLLELIVRDVDGRPGDGRTVREERTLRLVRTLAESLRAYIHEVIGDDREAERRLGAILKGLVEKAPSLTSSAKRGGPLRRAVGQVLVEYGA